jgi:hypothetical protein
MSDLARITTLDHLRYYAKRIKENKLALLHVIIAYNCFWLFNCIRFSNSDLILTLFSMFFPLTIIVLIADTIFSMFKVNALIPYYKVIIEL